MLCYHHNRRRCRRTGKVSVKRMPQRCMASAPGPVRSVRVPRGKRVKRVLREVYAGT